MIEGGSVFVLDMNFHTKCFIKKKRYNKKIIQDIYASQVDDIDCYRISCSFLVQIKINKMQSNKPHAL